MSVSVSKNQRSGRSGPPRGRGNNANGRHNGHSNGAGRGGGRPIRVSGNPRQAMERYLSLARDALSAGDRIAAEGFFQHAEHFYRVLNAETEDA